MELTDNMFKGNGSNGQEPTENKPEDNRIEDDDNLEEKDLKRSFLFGHGDMKSSQDPEMEGNGMGGENFGRNNITPAGNDKNTPSQLAGNNNAYFNRTQPAEEHPENNNFKDPDQAGKPDYDAAMHGSGNGHSDKKGDGGTESDDQDDPQQNYQEGTADDDGDKDKKQQINIPGPNELPDQQKVGE